MKAKVIEEDYCYLCKKITLLTELIQITVDDEVDLYCMKCGEMLQHSGSMRAKKE